MTSPGVLRRTIQSLIPALFALLAPAVPGQETAETIYVGGDILTMSESRPSAEALAVKDGRILAVGPEAEVMGLRGPETRIVDLYGRTMLPGFVDAHGHFSDQASYLQYANLAPQPAGSVRNIADLQDELRKLIETRKIPAGEWVVGAGYDPAYLAESRHPTKADLDAVSKDHRILIVHNSMHMGVVNSRVLAESGITADTPDPEGGIFGRVEGSREPNGVAKEQAFLPFIGALPRASRPEQIELIRQASVYYASKGFTTVQDIILDPTSWETLQAAAAEGALLVDCGAYPFLTVMDPIMAANGSKNEYRSGVKTIGIKVTLDGSVQGYTAFLEEPFFKMTEGQAADYRGFPSFPQDVVDSFAKKAYDQKWQPLMHCNGDAAADMMLDALEKAGFKAGDDRRPVMIHAQFVREDQFDRMKALGVMPSFFVSHVFYWGDYHRDVVLGAERASRISATASAEKRGLRYTFHNDQPVVPPSAIILLWSAVTRTTRSGAVLGPDQKIPVIEALRALTIDGAYQYFDENRTGSLEAGKLADLVILSDNPLEIAPEALKDLQVLETIKKGRTIYRAD